ncbi:MAG: TRAP transporter small permease [Thiolinea sp.]
MSDPVSTPSATTSASWIDRLERGFRYLLGGTAALFMFTMMLVTFVDVLGRDLFSAPLPGGFEITELLLASLIFLGLPLVTAAGGHVEVDLLDSVIPARLKRLQNGLINLLNILAFSVLSWLVWQYAFRTLRYQDTTAILHIPYAWLTFLMAITCTLSTLFLIIMAITGRRRLTHTTGNY